jgi:hypothetical protein
MRPPTARLCTWRPARAPRWPLSSWLRRGSLRRAWRSRYASVTGSCSWRTQDSELSSTSVERAAYAVQPRTALAPRGFSATSPHPRASCGASSRAAWLRRALPMRCWCCWRCSPWRRGWRLHWGERAHGLRGSHGPTYETTFLPACPLACPAGHWPPPCLLGGALRLFPASRCRSCCDPHDPSTVASHSCVPAVSFSTIRARVAPSRSPARSPARSTPAPQLPHLWPGGGGVGPGIGGRGTPSHGRCRLDCRGLALHS